MAPAPPDTSGFRGGDQLQEGKTDHGSRIVKYQGNLMDLLPSPLVTIDNVNDSHGQGAE